MKKFLIIICVTLLLGLIVTGCELSNAPQAPIPVTYINSEWIGHNSLDSLTAAAGRIFEGKVTNISFTVLSLLTGEPPTASDDLKYCMIHTIYEVQVGNSYKGDQEEKVYIKVMGGIKGYRETEQCELLKEKGMYNESIGIEVRKDFEPPKIGDSYLFLTNKWLYPINPAQGVYKVEDNTEKCGFTYEQVKAYVTK